MTDDPSDQAVADASGRGDTPLLHSDQERHYQMPAYRKQITDNGLTNGRNF
ncbi:hypothetical protein [Paucibacter sp. M5-1]|uniref:hypothetical protein n=1 Tax=Paucibacter sp. M5-1 TaxID=3015998 RepID=UPI0022B89D26|nr:hypothetical protein [Paucibacter sp. M5-1]MCZ7880463.1 hypothetical protein [Paucibacter sp. M5-1]